VELGKLSEYLFERGRELMIGSLLSNGKTLSLAVQMGSGGHNYV